MTYITTMVDEPGKVTTFGGVYNGLCVHSEEVAAPTSLSLVLFLPQVGQRLTKRFSHILYHHFISSNRLQCKQSPIVNATASKLQLFLSQLEMKPKSMLKYGSYVIVNPQSYTCTCNTINSNLLESQKKKKKREKI